MPPHPTLDERNGVFDRRYPIAGDYDLMLSRLTGRVVYVPQMLVRMRVGREQTGAVADPAQVSGGLSGDIDGVTRHQLLP